MANIGLFVGGAYYLISEPITGGSKLGTAVLDPLLHDGAIYNALVVRFTRSYVKENISCACWDAGGQGSRVKQVRQGAT